MNVKLLILLAAFAFGGAVGGGVVRYAWQAADLAAAKEQAEQMANLADQLRKLNDEKDSALSARDSALADLRDRDRTNAELLGRLRKQSSSVSNHPIGSCERHLAECRELLAEGAGLLAEGGEMVGRLDADRTAVRRLLK